MESEYFYENIIDKKTNMPTKKGGREFYYSDRIDGITRVVLHADKEHISIFKGNTCFAYDTVENISTQVPWDMKPFLNFESDYYFGKDFFPARNVSSQTSSKLLLPPQ